MTSINRLTTAVETARGAVQPHLRKIVEDAARFDGLDERLLSQGEREILMIKMACDENMPLINIATAISSGGMREDGFPHLAIASYSMSIRERILSVDVFDDGRIAYADDNSWRDWHLTLPANTLNRQLNIFQRMMSGTLSGSTTIPHVPPELRQYKPDDTVLLYEATEWKKRVIPAGDPYLLWHVAGYVYAILGTWDITVKEFEAFKAASLIGLRF
jgi:hypothetical protein